MPALRGSIRRLGGLAAVGTVIAGAVVAGAAPAAAIATLTVASPAPGALTAGTVGSAYAGVTFTRAGGTDPDSWMISSGTQPPGLNLNAGVLTGTPTTAGDYSFSVKVTDSGTPTPQTDTAAYTLHVTAIAPQPPTSVAAAAGSTTATVTFTVPSSTGIATGGEPLTGVVVTINPTSGPATTQPCSLPPVPCVITGLTNGALYTFTVQAKTADFTSGPSAASNAVRPGSAAQSINFTQPTTPQTFGLPPTLTATASSQLPVTFSSTTPSVCTVTPSGTLTLVTVGQCTINADQAGGTNNYASAPTVSRTFTVQAATPTVTVTSSLNPSVIGQPLTFTATLTNPVTTTGTVSWTVNAVAGVGTTTVLGTGGTATFTPNPALGVGSFIVKATYTPLGTDLNHNAASGQVTQVVGKAGTKTTVAVSGDTLTATVAPVAPGAGTPTGTVAFTVNGVAAGNGTVGAGGIATFTGSGVGSHAVAATYSGDANFLTSSGNRTPIGPTVVAHLTSAHAKHNGWYRAAVHVSFTCTANTSSTFTCPSTVTLSRNGRARSVTRTVVAVDGGTTTVTVSPINIDGTAPILSVKRHGNTVACHASDSLSHGATCSVHRTRTIHNGVHTLHWTATAHDRAGNTKRKSGHFSY